jgi:hypothetical protein
MSLVVCAVILGSGRKGRGNSGNLSVSVQTVSETVCNHGAEHQVNITSRKTLNFQCLFSRGFLNDIYVRAVP